MSKKPVRFGIMLQGPGGHTAIPPSGYTALFDVNVGPEIYGHLAFEN